jgi:hypothetical protein
VNRVVFINTAKVKKGRKVSDGFMISFRTGAGTRVAAGFQMTYTFNPKQRCLPADKNACGGPKQGVCAEFESTEMYYCECLPRYFGKLCASRRDNHSWYAPSLQGKTRPPSIIGASMAAVGNVAYMFGGLAAGGVALSTRFWRWSLDTGAWKNLDPTITPVSDSVASPFRWHPYFNVTMREFFGQASARGASKALSSTSSTSSVSSFAPSMYNSFPSARYYHVSETLHLRRHSLLAASHLDVGVFSKADVNTCLAPAAYETASVDEEGPVSSFVVVNGGRFKLGGEQATVLGDTWVYGVESNVWGRVGVDIAVSYYRRKPCALYVKPLTVPKKPDGPIKLSTWPPIVQPNPTLDRPVYRNCDFAWPDVQDSKGFKFRCIEQSVCLNDGGLPFTNKCPGPAGIICCTFKPPLKDPVALPPPEKITNGGRRLLDASPAEKEAVTTDEPLYKSPKKTSPLHDRTFSDSKSSTGYQYERVALSDFAESSDERNFGASAKTPPPFFLPPSERIRRVQVARLHTAFQLRRYGHSSCALDGNRMITAFGETAKGVYASTVLEYRFLQIKNEKDSTAVPTMTAQIILHEPHPSMTETPQLRYGAAIVCSAARIVLAGGVLRTGSIDQGVWQYDMVRHAWQRFAPAGDYLVPRYAHIAGLRFRHQAIFVSGFEADQGTQTRASNVGKRRTSPNLNMFDFVTDSTTGLDVDTKALEETRKLRGLKTHPIESAISEGFIERGRVAGCVLDSGAIVIYGGKQLQTGQLSDMHLYMDHHTDVSQSFVAAEMLSRRIENQEVKRAYAKRIFGVDDSLSVRKTKRYIVDGMQMMAGPDKDNAGSTVVLRLQARDSQSLPRRTGGDIVSATLEMKGDSTGSVEASVQDLHNGQYLIRFLVIGAGNGLLRVTINGHLLSSNTLTRIVRTFAPKWRESATLKSVLQPVTATVTIHPAATSALRSEFIGAEVCSADKQKHRKTNGGKAYKKCLPDEPVDSILAPRVNPYDTFGNRVPLARGAFSVDIHCSRDENNNACDHRPVKSLVISTTAAPLSHKLDKPGWYDIVVKTASGDQIGDSPLLLRVLACDNCELGGSDRSTILTFGLLTMLILAAMQYMLYRLRSHKVILSISVVFSHVLLAGLQLIALSTVFIAVGESPGMCAFTFSVRNVGVTAAYIGIGLKLYRLIKIFGNKDLKVMKNIDNKFLLKRLAIFVAYDIILSIFIGAAYPYKIEHRMCIHEYPTVFGALTIVVPRLVSVIFVLYLVVQSRSLPSTYNESTRQSIVVYTTILFGGLFGVMGITVLDLRQRALFASLGLCICCIFTSAVLLIPKFVVAAKTGGKKGGAAQKRGLALPDRASIIGSSSVSSSSSNFKSKVRGVVNSLFGSGRSSTESEFGVSANDSRRQSSVQLNAAAWSGLSPKELQRKLKIEEQQYAFSLQQLAKAETKVAEEVAAMVRRKEKVMQLMTELEYIDCIDVDDADDKDRTINSFSTGSKRLSVIDDMSMEDGGSAFSEYDASDGRDVDHRRNMSVESSESELGLEMSSLTGVAKYSRVGFQSAATPSDLLDVKEED